MPTYDINRNGPAGRIEATVTATEIVDKGEFIEFHDESGLVFMIAAQHVHTVERVRDAD